MKALLAAVTVLLTSPLPLLATTINFSKVEQVPLITVQLGDAALIAHEHFRENAISPGDPAFISAEGIEPIPVYLYPIDRDRDSVSLNRGLRDGLGVEPGAAALSITISTHEETGLPPAEDSVSIRASEGDRTKWPGMLIGAPHADGDFHTGVIAEKVAELAGIPSVTGWRGRLSFMGRWIDVNRPLQREPVQLFRIAPDRSWTPEAEAVYHRFRDAVVSVGTHPRHQPGEPPLEFYLDLHGHALTVTLPDGDTAPRILFEVVARGYTLDEVRQLKVLFDRAMRAEHGENTPPSYWANIPEDRRYEVSGVEAEFFYTGLGGRIYGILGPGIARRAIHIETPGVVRNTDDKREKTARALVSFLTGIRELPLQDAPQLPSEVKEPIALRFLSAPGGEFTLGNDEQSSWTGGAPVDQVVLPPFEITELEITNQQYIDFANNALANGHAHIAEGTLVESRSGNPLLLLHPTVALSGIEENGGQLATRPNLASHPVVNVTWHGAAAFAAHHDARLPTQAEWEYAAKWNPITGQSEYWMEGNDPGHENLPDGNYMHSPAREKGLIPASTVPVGTFPQTRSPIGCLDMAGNVWEWTQDWSGSETDEKKPTMKVIRGGSWDTEPVTTTATFRSFIAPHAALPTVGFRIARDAGPRGK